MLTSQQILDLIAQEPRPGLAGKVASHQRASRTSMNTFAGPESHRRFLADMADQAGSVGPPSGKYVHPADDARAGSSGRPAEALSPADIEWLRGLPTDPAQVSYDDAVQLARIAANASAFKDPSSARLINQRWTPVKEIHDARAAQVALSNAQTTAPSVPSSALSALTDAVAAETPQLQPDEAVARAGKMLRETLDRRNAAREQKLLDARAAIAKADEAATVRTRVTKDPLESRSGWTGP